MESQPERNIPQFKGDGYGAWKFRIKTVLEQLQVYSVIEGPLPENPDDEWTAKNTMAKGTIVNFLGDAFLHMAEGNATAKSIIESLDRLYERRNLTAQVALRKQMSNLKLQPNNSLSQHFTRFDKLISDLTLSGANLDEMDKVCQLLASLPSCYDGVIGPLEEFYGDNFNLGFVKTYLLDQEAKMEMETVTRLRDTITEAPSNKRSKPNNYNQYKYRNPSYSNTHVYCEFCGRNNHFIQNCRFYNAPNNCGPRNIFPAMFPPCPPKVPKRLRKKAFVNNIQKNRANINPYSVPNIKAENEITVKEEPVTVKRELVEIKQEPMWVKQEPHWEEQPIKSEPGTGQTPSEMYVTIDGTENSAQGPDFGQMAPGTVIKQGNNVYFVVPKRRKNKNKLFNKRVRKIAMLMMQAENRTDVITSEQQPITNPVEDS